MLPKEKRKFIIKILLIMKLTVFFLMVLALQVSAKGYSQNVTLSLKNTPIKQVFEEVKKQTGLSFLWDEATLEKTHPVTITLKDAPIEAVLEACVKNQPITYTIIKNMVVIKLKPVNQKKVDIVDLPFIDVSGRVVNEKNEPIEGVTVTLIGTKKATATNKNGQFTLNDINDNGVLVISSIGYETVEIKINGRTSISVTLKISIKKAEEVVINTGYFSRNKESFTGAAVSYSADEIRKANPVNILSALSILEPSFKMVENSMVGSDPNVIPDFVVRGEASLPNLEGDFKGNPNNPIFILDGFEVSAERIFDLDPVLVSSITILKDAASTAIYGSRASNGVVIIELRLPESGTLNVLYNIDLSYTTPDLRDYQLLNAAQKLELEKAAGFYDLTGEVSANEKRQDEYNEKLKLIEKGNNTYWLNKPLQAALGQKHSISLQGGQMGLRYALDVKYEQAPGVMKGSSRNKMGISTMLQYRYKNITFRNSLLYDNVEALNSPYGQFSQYARINPYFRYDDAEGNYIKSFSTGQWFLNFPNPLYNTRLHNIDKTSYNQFINNFSLDWSISSALRMRGNFSIKQKRSEGVMFKSADHTDFLSYNIPSAHLRGQYRSSEGKEYSYDGKVQLNYFNNFGKHVINSGIAANLQEVSGEDYSVLVEGFPADKLDYLIFGLQYPEGSRPIGSDNISRLFGVVSSTNYSYDNRFLLDFSFRADASSKFGIDNLWAPFWSVGTGWNLHNEKLLKQVSSINKFRIRASYGVTGSQAFNPYQSMTQYEYYMTDVYNYMMGATMKALGNSSLKWQQTHQTNVGLDLELFKRVEVTANFYQNNSKSLLADITLPPSLGFLTYKENVGELLNKGFDVNLKTTVYRNKNSYVNVVLGAVKNVNTIQKISNSLSAWNDTQDALKSNKPKVRFVEGESINVIWGVPSVGINPANGKEIFIRPDGSRTDEWDPAYQQPIGISDPDLEGNAGLNAGLENFTFNLYFRYRIGGQMYNTTLVERIENADKRYNTDIRVLEERWQKPGDITFFKDVSDNSITQASSRFINDYSFLQLTSMNLSYDFSKTLISKFSMKSARLSFSMNDVFRFSSVKIERGLNYPFSASFRTSLRVMF